MITQGPGERHESIEGERMAEEHEHPADLLSVLADQHIGEQTGHSWTLLYVVGDPDTYNDRLPDEWNVGGEVVKQMENHDLVRFHPRSVEFRDSGDIILTDGTLGMYEEYDLPESSVEFEHVIEPDQYAVALMVFHHPHADSRIPDRSEQVCGGALDL